MDADILPKVFGTLLGPPGLLVIFLVLGFLMSLKRLWLGTLVFVLGILIVIGLSMPVMGHRLRAGVEAFAQPLDLAALPQPLPQAIVVLGGGRITRAPEFAADSVNAMTLERLRYAAQLARKSKLPVLVSGGAPFAEETPEAVLMARSLADDFGIAAKWTETQSATTADNARLSAAMLEKDNIQRVFLVTSAVHMRRALLAFASQTSLDVTPAPTGFSTSGADAGTVLGYLPSGRGIYNSSLAIHERLGFFWYNRKFSP